MKAASGANFVLGYTCVGPTCSAVSVNYRCRLGARSPFVSFAFKGPLSVAVAVQAAVLA
jgi:hypothetical protein